MARASRFEDVRALCLALPGVVEGTSYGTPAFRVGRRLFVRLREDGASIVLKVGADARDALMQSDPGAYFLTDHYRGSPSLVLVRFAELPRAELGEVIEQAWRGLAGNRLRAQR